MAARRRDSLAATARPPARISRGLANAPGGSRVMIAFESAVTPPPAEYVVERFPHPVALARPRRFTLDGDDALERHLERTCARVLSGIRGLIPAKKLEAVLLGGGYGRGEGGVLRSLPG